LGDLKQGEELITEETEWNAEKSHSDYAISKHGAEMEVWRGWQEGLDVVIVNPGVIFGYGFWQQGSNRMLHSIKNGQRYYTDGHCGIVAVEDVVAVMIQLMEAGVSGERYILVAKNMPVQKIFNLLADGMAVKKPSKLAGPALTSFAWRVDWLVSLLLSRRRKFTRAIARSSHSKEYYSNAKILTHGFQFRNMEVYLKGLATQFVQSVER
jgi:nucleoside-diphosphate-sugar epimerase